MEKHYTPKTWKNSPNTDSPINEYWLNHIEAGINENDNRSVLLDANKLDKSAAQKYVKSVTLDKKTGVLTVTLVDGTKTSTDLDIEKVVTNFDLDENNNLVLTLADGVKKTVPLSKFIDTYTFKNSGTVSFSVKGKEITAIIPDGVITLGKLEASVVTTIRQYTLDAQTAKGQAEQAAQTAGGWAIGGVEGFETNNSKYFANRSKRYAVGGVEEGDTTDNAKHYCEEARKAAEQAAGSAGFDGTANTVTATDTQGLVGSKGGKTVVQKLLDKVAEIIVNKVVTTDTFQTQLGKYLVNNGLATVAGKTALDAAYGKTLADQVTKLNSGLGNNWAGVVSIIPKITADSTGTWASGTANITQPGLLRISGNTNGEYGMVKLSINNQDVLGYQNSAGLYTFSYRVRKGDIVGVSVVNTADVEASLLTL